MNTYYSLFAFFLVQIALKFSNAKVTVDTLCKNGILAQMSNHFKCICNEGFLHHSENECEVKNECKEDTVGKACGDFSRCVKNEKKEGVEKEDEYKCICNEGYTLTENVCVLTECIAKNCGENGECIVEQIQEDKNAACSCPIGKIRNPEDENKCTKEGETKCDLKCTKENEICKNVDGVYKCQCMEGFNFNKDQDTCVAFSVFNILNLSLVAVIVIALAYMI
ncbi:ookinete surface protein Pvs25 [Plasmodium gonderi]|uniref:Ookinete surface protein P25 n=1 Tax=Plasmodium gonderi TaxID=77519 RepID=A0A1B0WVN8_PLAGO|nr:ookinete surface protein Pvs25 [Plasmodium gonderi]AND94971.1 ookinete surface protein P25 [Plasmodium gonderi]GAW80010.1 ookinete surface protein Pvs25 [Plasmodium gonderi]